MRSRGLLFHEGTQAVSGEWVRFCGTGLVLPRASCYKVRSSMCLRFSTPLPFVHNVVAYPGSSRQDASTCWSNSPVTGMGGQLNLFRSDQVSGILLGQLLSLSSVHWSSFCVFSWLANSLRCLDISQFIYPFTYWRISWWLPSLGIYEWSYCKHSCAGFCVNLSFQLLWVNTEECSCWIIC